MQSFTEAPLSPAIHRDLDLLRTRWLERRVAALELELRSYRIALADATAVLHERDPRLSQLEVTRS